MPRIVLDSNVLISALHFGGKPEELLQLANQGAFELFVSPFILEETTEVLLKKFGWSDRQAQKAEAVIREIATVVAPKVALQIIPDDESDNRILECAIEVDADYLMTGNRRHLLPLRQYKSTRILTPRDCLDLLLKPGS